MLRPFLTFLCLLCLSVLLPAQQPQISYVSVNSGAEAETVYPVPFSEEMPFLAFAVKWTDPTGLAGWPMIRFSTDQVDWTEWMVLEADAHTAFEAPVFLSGLQTTAAEHRFFQVQFPLSEGIVPAEVHLIDPGKTIAGASEPKVIDSPEACPCPHPDYEGRLDWCPSGDCPTDPTPFPTVVTHLIVHHSAGSNTSSDWAARVRAIWAFHTGSNGWDDIGYNWLIDPNGVLYEGRSDNMQGAHFCGQNGGTMGICVIGTYTDVPPTNDAITTLRNLLAWKSCKEGIDPEDFSFHNSSGLNLFHISGHRDGCSTVCPGDSLWVRLPDIRFAVANYIENDCSAFPGPNQLVATLTDATTAEVIWVDSSSTETAFLLERGTPGMDDFIQIASLPANTTSYEDADLLPGGYAYRVRATDGVDTTFYSNEDDVLVLPSGVIRVGESTELEVFPVPFDQNLQVVLKGAETGTVQLDLLSVEGRSMVNLITLQKLPGEQAYTIPTEALPAGVYYLQIRMSGEVQVQKLIKHD
jgi:hypothetical protein